MESNKYLDDITEIKNIMNRSSRFISLSGMSGVLAGLYALVGAFLANQKIKQYSEYLADYDQTNIPLSAHTDELPNFSELINTLILIAIGVIVAAVITGIILTIKKTKKNEEKIWDVSSKRLVVNFLIPLMTGAAFCYVLMEQGQLLLLGSTTLIFYGLACVNASKYTMGDVRYMGIAFIILGLVSTQFLGYGLYFWALGFGVCHIVYGALMYFKYDRKEVN